MDPSLKKKKGFWEQKLSYLSIPWNGEMIFLYIRGFFQQNGLELMNEMNE